MALILFLPQVCLSQNYLVKKKITKQVIFFFKIHAKIAEKEAFLFFLLTNLLHTSYSTMFKLVVNYPKIIKLLLIKLFHSLTSMANGIVQIWANCER